MKNEDTSRPVAEKIRTEIWTDIPGKGENKFDREISLCRGYDFFNGLLGRYSWNDLLFLQIRGELPTKKESSILNIVMSSIINPGPRDWSTQTAMTAAVTRTTVGNCLTAGLATLQGRYNGGLCVEESIAMLREGVNIREKNSILEIVRILEEKYPDLPGYGMYYSNRDKRPARLIQLIEEEKGKGKHLTLALEMEKEISEKKGIWLTIAGAVAAILADLDFSPQEGHGIFLISAAPGLLAHLLEQLQGFWNTYPFYRAPIYEGPESREIEDNQKVYGG